MSVAMRLLAPNLEGLTATDYRKVPSLVAQLSVPIKDILNVTRVKIAAR